ncbi:hypothetical protein [Limosilactobacillus caecicola]|uniref:hypothetical protein n=1 Tax=Limosilactobacillus caecicola TaxID=2941332 RepID=UPI0020411178|nr:hypothetical protein [Limosilactobacillus caecicola]
MKKSAKFLAICGITFLTGITTLDTVAINSNSQIAFAKATQTTLGSGEFKVGKDIKPGRYTITAQSGSGNVTGSNDLNIILGDSTDDDLGQIDSYTMDLKKGAKVKIDGIEATDFTPVTKRSYQKNLKAGQWVVGKDIKPGRYTIKATAGSGNLSSDKGINEILGTDADSDLGQVTKTTQTLHRGEVLNSDLEGIQLIKK